MAGVNFFSLPRELRDIIYALGFESGCYCCKEGPWLFDLRLGAQLAGPIRALPLWLLASKQVMEEGLWQFYREAVCVFIRDEDLDEGDSKPHLLLRPQSIQHGQATLDVAILPLKWWGPDGDKMTIQLIDRALGTSPREQKYFVRSVSLNAKSLSVRFSLDDCGDLTPLFGEEQPPRFVFDSSHLDVYGQTLERIKLEISQPDFDDFQWCPTRKHRRFIDFEIVYIAFQNAIQKWALEKISGPEKKSCVIKDWVERAQAQSDDVIRYKWYFEAYKTEKKGGGSVRHRGVFSFGRGYRTTFGERMEKENGLVEWRSGKGEVEGFVRPQWLVDYANEDWRVGDASVLGKRKSPG